MISRVWLALGLLLIVSCAAPPAADTRPSEAAASAPSRTGPKRIVAAITGDPPTLYNKLNTNNAIRGVDAVEKLVSAGSVIEDDRGELRPQLVEAVPSVDNGLWQLAPDGTMVTTWQLRPGARWHDGMPLTADDLAFTLQVWQDRELPAFSFASLSSLDGVEVVDPQTLRAKWKRPFIDADRMFGIGTQAYGLPLPKHLLEKEYQENKAAFSDLPYFSTAFVGNGPFKLKEWTPGSSIVLEAFDGYALGRPKIDQIEVRFILDANTLVSNVLAGEVDLTLGRGISIEQAISVQSQWRGGTVDTGSLRSGFNLWPQLMDPTPAIVSDVRFRRAMLTAIDRQSMVDTLQGGLTPIVHSWLRPSEPEFIQLEPQIVYYPYDQRKAIEGIEALGYTRGADGFFRDASGQKLSVEFRTISVDINQKTLLAVADYWQRAGVTVDQVVIPSQRQNDLPYRATFPAFELLRGNVSIENFNNLHSSGIRLPENNFRGAGGTNYNRYINPELDALIDRYFSTIQRPPRMEVAGQIVHLMTDQVLNMGMFYDLAPALESSKLRGLTGMGGDGNLPWNAQEWDIQ